MEYESLPLGQDDEWGAMQRRVMECCSDAVHEIGKPQDILILMPQLMIDGKWAGSNRSPQLSQLLEASLKKAAYTPTDATANHMEMAYDKLDSDDHEGAIEAFRAATKFAPTKFGSSTWFNLGIALTDAEARGELNGEDQAVVGDRVAVVKVHRQRHRETECCAGAGSGSLTAGGQYVFLLTTNFDAAQAGDLDRAPGTSGLTVIVNAPPTSGTLTVDPASGVVMQDAFSFACSGWVDDVTDLPLLYSFFFLIYGDVTEYQLVSKTPTTSCKTQPLPSEGLS